MASIVRVGRVPALCLALAACAAAPTASLVAGREACVEGSIVSIDTSPWAYDGHAIVVLDSREHGRLSVQLPARWNLCEAAAVDVEALVVGMPVRAVGTIGAEREFVVCEQATHRLAPLH